MKMTVAIEKIKFIHFNENIIYKPKIIKDLERNFFFEFGSKHADFLNLYFKTIKEPFDCFLF
jgi:hypothetical protein